MPLPPPVPGLTDEPQTGLFWQLSLQIRGCSSLIQNLINVGNGSGLTAQQMVAASADIPWSYYTAAPEPATFLLLCLEGSVEVLTL